jgi:hypothetical protein
MFKNLNLSRWIRPVFFFDADDKGGAGGSGNTEADAKAKAEADEKAKQDALNQQFAERAQRAADAERKKLLESLGVKDADEAAALLKVARDTEDKTKSETEKLQAQLKSEQEARAKAETEAKEKTEAANKRLLDSEIKINASTALIEKDKIVRPAFKREALDDVLLLIDRKLIEEKDGAFKGVDKALAELAKAKPWLLEEKQQAPRGTPPMGPRGRQGDDGQPRTPIISSL